jgi:hypothetical protein
VVDVVAIRPIASAIVKCAPPDVSFKRVQIIAAKGLLFVTLYTTAQFPACSFYPFKKERVFDEADNIGADSRNFHKNGWVVISHR